LRQDFSQLAKNALETGFEDFVRIVEEATFLLSSQSGKVGEMEVLGKLAKLKASGKALIVGDLHGDLESLIGIMKESNFMQKMDQEKDAVLIFLGDYGDRGVYSAEVYHIVLELKLLYPEQVVLMRGNHEGPEDLTASPHDLPMQLRARFGENGDEAYTKIRGLFEQLINAVIVKGRYLVIHGGLPLQARRIEDLAYAHISHPKQAFLEEMLWSDPDEMIREEAASPRGAGRLFGKKVTEEVLKRFGVKLFIRGHQSCPEGFRTSHDGKVLTLFSRKGSPYFNAYGAYLELDLSKQFENAEQLVPYIHRF